MNTPAARRPDRTPLVRIIAVVTGLIGLVLALLTPLLPVRQTTVAIDWPQAGRFAPVSAPLVQYRPQDLTAHIPCALLASAPADQETAVFSTLPAAAGDSAQAAGLFVTVDGRSVTVRSRGSLVVTVPRAEAAHCTTLTVSATAQRVTATFTGIPNGSGSLTNGDYRPQVVGLFSDLATGGAAPAGLSAHVTVDSRYSTTPTLLKGLAMILGALAVVVSIVALAVLDRGDGRRARRVIPGHWLHVGLADAVVVGALLIWHIVGAPTSDDGYILGMAKASLHSGYMPEVFRYYDAPYAPFGMPYYLVSWMTELSVSSPWLRLPTLVAAIATWLLLSREVLPRLGLSRRRDRRDYHRALWATAAVFLLFWLTYNPGLRPEPIVAFGTVVTWCCVERSVATRRLAPAAVGLVVAGLTLSAAPTGSFAFAVFVVAARPLWAALAGRVRAASVAGSAGSRTLGYAAELAPLLAAASAVLLLIFADHSLREMLQSTHLLSQVGPSEPWFKEIQRYDALLQANPNGSIARRFAMFAMFASVGAVLVVLLRRRRIPGIASGPALRVASVILMSLLLMMFNPTKWTHHFGAFAGFGAMIAAVAVVAVGPRAIRTARYRVAFLAALFAILALCFESTNGWFYPGNYGIPWGGAAPTVAGVSIASVFVVLAVLTTVWAVILLIRGDGPAVPTIVADNRLGRAVGGVLARPVAAPLTLAAALVVALIGASNVMSIINQYPAYSYGLQNLRSLAGHPCGEADGVLAEPDADAGTLTPVSGTQSSALAGEHNENFTPDGVATDLTATNTNADDVVQTGDASRTAANTGGTGGGTLATPGVNGSTAALPFGLDPARTPVLGSLQTGDQQVARAVSGWYRLPGSSGRPLGAGKLLVVTVAGRIESGGFVVEFGRADGAGFRAIGTVTPIDIGPAPAWRNLRVPAAMVPSLATVMRIRATVTSPSAHDWVAYTPPRVPHLEPLGKLVGRDAVLIDWGAGIAFPCQRQWTEFGGIAEQPKWRIQPERDLAVAATTTWEGGSAGGPLGWTLMSGKPDTVATYLDSDWSREWGALERYIPYVPDATPAHAELGSVTRSGMWSPGPIAH
ncbi:arabinosyltransferase domain-containing protein [Tsukamurella soli]|uniref:Arabinosyltransferase domain-containing protein n=1 Tax=Tsukamurella soli TaxID=644556 RepID=A0ABP8JMC0_9ACTN